jgi:hypothetical protein
MSSSHISSFSLLSFLFHILSLPFIHYTHISLQRSLHALSFFLFFPHISLSLYTHIYRSHILRL